MALARKDGWWLWVGGPVPKGAAGFTFGPVVCIRAGHENSERLLRHEQEHVRQFKEHGIIGFLARYGLAYLGGRLRGYGHWAAYRRIPFEASAEFRARRSLGWGSESCPNERGEGRVGKIDGGEKASRQKVR